MSYSSDLAYSKYSGLFVFFLYLSSILDTSVKFSHSVVSNSLWRPGLQCPCRPPCPSPTPGACSNSCPSSRWCHPTISSSAIPFTSYLQSFPASGSFPMSFHIRWPKYWSFSFSISPSNEYSGLISLGSNQFRIDWLDLLLVQGTLKSLQHQSSKVSFLYSPTLTYIHDYWKNCSFD